jgi:predicted outer membrane protein
MLSVLIARRSARLLVGAAVVAVMVGGPATASMAAPAPATAPVAAEPEPGLVQLDPSDDDNGASERRSGAEDDAEDGSRLELNSTADGAGDGSATGAGAEIPLLPSDVDLLIRARLAGLWEMPAGEMAVEKGKSPRVREIGKMIRDQHVRLDALTVNAANQVGVVLPTEPNSDQKHWLQEMKDAEGAEFDRIFVDRLRAAHGVIYPAIGAVRVGTRNPVVRKLAEQANGFVGNHLDYLESTGLVDYQSLPEPPLPNKNPLVTGTGPLDAAAARAAQGGINLTVIYALLLTCLIAGAIGTARFLRPRWGVGRLNDRAAVAMPTRVERPTPITGPGGPRSVPSPQGGTEGSPAYPRPLARPRS